MIVKVICYVDLVVSDAAILLCLILLIISFLFIRIKTNDLYLINKSVIIILLYHTIILIIVKSLSRDNVCINILLIFWQIFHSLLVNFGASPFPHRIDLNQLVTGLDKFFRGKSAFFVELRLAWRWVDFANKISIAFF